MEKKEANILAFAYVSVYLEAIIKMHLTIMIHTDVKQDYETNKGITILLNHAILIKQLCAIP